MSFHPFKFYFPVLFVQGYCSLPDFFYEVVVIFGTPGSFICECFVAIVIGNNGEANNLYIADSD